MRESVLLMNFKDKKQLKGIQMIAFFAESKKKIRMVGERDFFYSRSGLPWLGVEGIAPSEETFTGEAPEHEIMVFAGVSDAKLQRMLTEIRRNGIRKVEHKAILTPTNVHWNTIELYEELEQERQAMEAAAREREHVDVKERSDL